MDFYTEAQIEEMIDEAAADMGIDRDQVAPDVFVSLACDVPGWDFWSDSKYDTAETAVRNYAREYERYLAQTPGIVRWVRNNIAPLPSF
jgi:hypothetical protein